MTQKEDGFYLEVDPSKILRNAAIGLSFVAAYIFLNLAFKVFMPIPNEYWSGGFFAPIVEEILFRGLVPIVFASLGLPYIINVIISSLGFSASHYLAYGGSIALFGGTNAGAFIGAFIFSILAFTINAFTKDMISNIVFHGGVDIWLLHELGFVIIPK